MTSNKKINRSPPSNKILQLQSGFEGQKSVMLGQTKLPSRTLKNIKEAKNPCDIPCIVRQHKKDLTKKKKKPKHKNIQLIAPIKFIIKGSSFLQYARSPHHEVIAWQAALLQFAYYAMGASIMPVIWFTFQCVLPWQINLHIFLHTLGFMFLVAWGLMITNPYDSAAFFMQPDDKHTEATALKLAGFFLNITAFLIMLVYSFKTTFLSNFTYHSVFGISAVLLSLFDLPSILILSVNRTNQKIYALTLFLHTLSFVLASVSYFLALNRKSLVDWYPYKQIGNLCIGFGIYYVINVVYSPVYNLFNEMNHHSLYVLGDGDKKNYKKTLVGDNLALLRNSRMRYKYRNKPVELPFVWPK